MARVRQVQARTSLYRFVREHLMRQAQPNREQLPIEAGFLFDAAAGGLVRTPGRPGHVLDLQCLGGDHRAGGHQSRCRLMQELPAQIADAVVQPRR